MRREQANTYRDQFEYLADCFDLIRKRGDALNIRNEAMETERMVRYSERTGFESERSHLLEIYRDIEAEIEQMQTAIDGRKAETEALGLKFPIDHFVERHGLGGEETRIVLVLLYNESVGRTHARFQTGNDILNLLFPNPVQALKASQHLDIAGPLSQRGLIRSTSDDDSPNFLRATYEVSEQVLVEVLGVRDRHQVSRKTERHHAASQVPDAPYRAISPRVSLDRVILNQDLRSRLEELLWQIEHGDVLFREWGMDRVLEKGRGTAVLFCGPPGTGKTMTAEALADRLGRQLFVVDYSQMESKWIGETEKNIVTVFRDAAAMNAVLLVDEADAILASRLDGGHYNDRAYNRQVSLLLTEMESFDGVCILTTNREVSLDPGLARRIAARLDFPVPGPEERAAIWMRLLPSGIPLAADVNIALLAARHVMAGGHIKNSILAAVRRAARREGREARVSQVDFESAAARERSSFEAESRRIGFHEAQDMGFA